MHDGMVPKAPAASDSPNTEDISALLLDNLIKLYLTISFVFSFSSFIIKDIF